MMAKWPMTRILTSWACRFLISTGFAVCSRKAARSTGDLSGFEPELQRQHFIEASNVGILRRGHEVEIERGEFVDVVGHCFSQSSNVGTVPKFFLVSVL